MGSRSKKRPKDEPINVRVRTLPNGYDLDVDGTGFMYFTINELIEGFFVHVALEEVDYMDKKTMQDLITACAIYPNEGDAIKATTRFHEQIEALEQSHQRDASVIANLKARIVAISDELAKTKRKLNAYVTKEKKAKKEDEKYKPKSKWDGTIIHKADIVTKKKIIKVKPDAKPLEMKPVPKSKDCSELEKKLKEKGVLK